MSKKVNRTCVVLDKKSPAFKFIEKECMKNQTHGSTIGILDIVNIIDPVGAVNFAKSVKGELSEIRKSWKVLFHGTNEENILKILKTVGSGFVLDFQKRGGLLGPGLYFAPDPCKAHNYSRSTEKFLLRCLIYVDPNNHKYATFGAYDEYCILNQNHLLITHVIHVTKTQTPRTGTFTNGSVTKGQTPNWVDEKRIKDALGIGKNKKKCRHWEKCRKTDTKKHPDHTDKYYHPCRYGEKCWHVKKKYHRINFTHPCKAGSKCKDDGKVHQKEFSHNHDDEEEEEEDEENTSKVGISPFPRENDTKGLDFTGYGYKIGMPNVYTSQNQNLLYQRLGIGLFNNQNQFGSPPPSLFSSPTNFQHIQPPLQHQQQHQQQIPMKNNNVNMIKNRGICPIVLRGQNCPLVRDQEHNNLYVHKIICLKNNSNCEILHSEDDGISNDHDRRYIHRCIFGQNCPLKDKKPHSIKYIHIGTNNSQST